MPITPRTLISARLHNKSGFGKLQGYQRRPIRPHSLDLLTAPPHLWIEEIDASQTKPILNQK
jgi:hypothetical protein